GPKAAWSSRSTFVIDEVHSGHRSTSTRTDQTLSAGLKTSTDTSIFISTPAWAEATSLPSTIQGELLKFLRFGTLSARLFASRRKIAMNSRRCGSLRSFNVSFDGSVAFLACPQTRLGT